MDTVTDHRFKMLPNSADLRRVVRDDDSDVTAMSPGVVHRS